METLSIAEFALRLGVGLGCGALIGIERQWQARRAGLRTNALVATGATLFVLYAVATNDSSPTRAACSRQAGISCSP
jgi:putative Mg2+ transporter-C (MgtC) family protein